jgi:hypothetical protein
MEEEELMQDAVILSRRMDTLRTSRMSPRKGNTFDCDYDKEEMVTPSSPKNPRRKLSSHRRRNNDKIHCDTREADSPKVAQSETFIAAAHPGDAVAGMPLHYHAQSTPDRKTYKYMPGRSQRKEKSRLHRRLVQDDVIGALTMRDVLCKGVHSPTTSNSGAGEDELSTSSTCGSCSTSNPSIITTMDSDKELEIQSRQIRLELRRAEMIELLEEAERAAAAGQKRFAGRTSTFGVDDPELEIPAEGFKAKQALVNHPLVRRSLNFGTPLGRKMLPDNFSKISVKALRDVAEVIPNFKDFHMHLRTHFLRRKVTGMALVFREKDPNSIKHNNSLERPNRGVQPRSHENEHQAMHLWNSFSLHSWRAITSPDANGEGDTTVQQIPAESVSERQPTRRRSDKSNGGGIGELLAGHEELQGANGIRRHPVKVPPGLKLPLAFHQQGACRSGSELVPSPDRHKTAFGAQQTTPPRVINGVSALSYNRLYPQDTQESDSYQSTQDGSPDSPIFVDDDDDEVMEATNALYQNNARFFHGAGLPPDLPLTPKENFDDVFSSNFTTRRDLGLRSVNRFGSSGPDFVTPARLRDIRDNKIVERAGDSALQDAVLVPRKEGANPLLPSVRKQPVEEINTLDVEVINGEATEHVVRHRRSEHPPERLSLPALVYGETQVVTDLSGMVDEETVRSGDESKQWMIRLAENLRHGAPLLVSSISTSKENIALHEVIDVEDIKSRRGADGKLQREILLARLDPLRRGNAGEGSREDPRGAWTRRRGESEASYRMPRNQLTPGNDSIIEETGNSMLVAEIESASDRKEGSVTDDSIRADQSKTTADYPCECFISPASSIGSDDYGGAVARRPAWNLLKQASRESKHQSLQAAMAMFSSISPSGIRSSTDATLVSLKENDDFISNYLYCSKTSEPEDPAPEPTCSGQDPCQESKLPCGEIALDSCVGSFMDSALKFLPRKSSETNKLPALSLNRDSTYPELQGSSISWYDLANERFDRLLEGLMGTARRSGENCRLSFQAPTLKEWKTPKSPVFSGHDEVYDEDLEGHVYIKNTASLSSTLRQSTSD